jgi:hypothetical protein
MRSPSGTRRTLLIHQIDEIMLDVEVLGSNKAWLMLMSVWVRRRLNRAVS